MYVTRLAGEGFEHDVADEAEGQTVCDGIGERIANAVSAAGAASVTSCHSISVNSRIIKQAT